MWQRSLQRFSPVHIFLLHFCKDLLQVILVILLFVVVVSIVMSSPVCPEYIERPMASCPDGGGPPVLHWPPTFPCHRTSSTGTSNISLRKSQSLCTHSLPPSLTHSFTHQLAHSKCSLSGCETKLNRSSHEYLFLREGPPFLRLLPSVFSFLPLLRPPLTRFLTSICW